MADSYKVLIDTSAFYALLSPQDLFHKKAKNAFDLLIKRNHSLWTTSYTLVETLALVHRRLGSKVVLEFIQWQQSNVETYWVSQRIHDDALERFVEAEGKGLSFVDCTTMTVSRELDAQVFTFDGGFVKAGLPVVPR